MEEKKKNDIDIDEIDFGTSPKKYTIRYIESFSSSKQDEVKSFKIHSIVSLVSFTIAIAVGYKLDLQKEMTNFYDWIRSVITHVFSIVGGYCGFDALLNWSVSRAYKKSLDEYNTIYVGERLGSLENVDFASYHDIQEAVSKKDFEKANRLLDVVEDTEISVKDELMKYREMAIIYNIARENNDEAAMTTIAAELARKGKQLIPKDEEEEKEEETKGPEL